MELEESVFANILAYKEPLTALALMTSITLASIVGCQAILLGFY